MALSDGDRTEWNELERILANDLAGAPSSAAVPPRCRGALSSPRRRRIALATVFVAGIALLMAGAFALVLPLALAGILQAQGMRS
ncbi:DUF3040 domain-containing protein [Arthrobacter agilis]|uniref:DUF3040 domain-containing protein n=1 Tax=Arthrobacter agilis TaxID=37921 RepID=UPI000B352B18|nr:DUF3040 domain-containing protein [Arthrobacter agilis]OUM42127.1 hypothetical protein B8W74_08385 [Arthrobacter agilis]PPB45471.1 DUF3040 domain-containing protein [Arthrobacter agilis]TPV26553.1 DUF3040 domain-containing protein [Arthrobacter agilis]VDR33534.1 Uncharacterised protein [Arthrobacter agilis]